MTASSQSGDGPASFTAIDHLLTDRPGSADDLAGHAVAAVEELRSAKGFVAGRVHIGVDRRIVSTRTLWRRHDDYLRTRGQDPAAGILAPLAGRPGVHLAATFQGTPGPHITGPQADQTPGVVAIATRVLRDADAFDPLLRLFFASAGWKRQHRGFISATPHMGLDGHTFVMYPMWTDAGSYAAWNNDPRVGEGQAEIAALEAVPPVYVLYDQVRDVMPTSGPIER